MNRKKVWKWIRVIIVIYIACGVALYFLQDKLLFHPRKLPEDHVFSFRGPFKELNLAVNDKKNLNIVQFTVPDSTCRGVVLYFHGNMENVERYAPFAANFTKNDYETWMIDYPGFGKSTGERSEQVFYDDALEFYKMARAKYSKDSIIIYGKSIGTGIAARLASARDCKRLILETPYYSIDALFRKYAFIYPVSWMSHYHFPSYQYLPKVNAPITIFHGTNDGLVPYEHSQRLLKVTMGRAELVTLEKGRHNNLNDFPLFHHKLDSVLQLP